MYVDYNPESERLGFNLDLGRWGNVDLNFAASDYLKGQVQDQIKTISEKVGFDFFGLKTSEAAKRPTDPEVKPPFWTKDKIILASVFGSATLLILATNIRRRKK